MAWQQRKELQSGRVAKCERAACARRVGRVACVRRAQQRRGRRQCEARERRRGARRRGGDEARHAQRRGAHDVRVRQPRRYGGGGRERVHATLRHLPRLFYACSTAHCVIVLQVSHLPAIEDDICHKAEAIGVEARLARSPSRDRTPALHARSHPLPPQSPQRS